MVDALVMFILLFSAVCGDRKGVPMGFTNVDPDAEIRTLEHVMGSGLSNGYCETVDTPNYCQEPNTRYDFSIPKGVPHWEIGGIVGKGRSLEITAKTCMIYSHAVAFCSNQIDPKSDVSAPRCLHNEYSQFDSVPILTFFSEGNQYIQDTVPIVDTSQSPNWSEGIIEDAFDYTWSAPFSNACNRITEIFRATYKQLGDVFGVEVEHLDDGSTLETLVAEIDGYCEIAPSVVESYGIDYSCTPMHFEISTLTKDDGVNSTVLAQGFHGQVLDKKRAVILIPITLPEGQEINGIEILLDEDRDPLRFMIQQFLVYGPTRNYLDLILVNTAEGKEISSVGTSGTLKYTITTTANGVYDSISQDLSTEYHVEYHSDSKDFLSVAEEFVFAKPEEAYESYIIGQPLTSGGSYFALSYFPKSAIDEKYVFVEEKEPKVEFMMKDGKKHRIMPGEDTGLKFTKVEDSDPMWEKLDKSYIDCEKFLCSAWKMDLNAKNWKVKYNGEKPMKVVITGVNKIDIGGRKAITDGKSSVEEAETTFYTPDEKQSYLFLEIFFPSMFFSVCCCFGLLCCLCCTILIVLGCSVYSILCAGGGAIGSEISQGNINNTCDYGNDVELLLEREKKNQNGEYKSTIFADRHGED